VYKKTSGRTGRTANIFGGCSPGSLQCPAVHQTSPSTSSTVGSWNASLRGERGSGAALGLPRHLSLSPRHSDSRRSPCNRDESVGSWNASLRRAHSLDRKPRCNCFYSFTVTLLVGREIKGEACPLQLLLVVQLRLQSHPCTATSLFPSQEQTTTKRTRQGSSRVGDVVIHPNGLVMWWWCYLDVMCSSAAAYPLAGWPPSE
jgi:hypothetical protein